jgi:hypothetical protein
MTKINQFFGCSSIEEIQLRFDELSKVFADQDEILQILKSEYSTLMNVLSASESKSVEIEKENVAVTAKIIELKAKINPEGLRLELIGSWVWVSGATFDIKDSLKSLGFRYSPDKKNWFWRASENRARNARPLPFEKIRELYGASVVAL